MKKKKERENALSVHSAKDGNKNRNGKNLTEAESIRKRLQE